MPLYRIRTVHTGVTGAPWLSTFYFDSAGGTAGQAAAAVELFWFAVKAFMSSSVTATNDGIAATLNEATGEVTSAVSYAATPQVGALGGTQLPHATQGLIRWQTGVYSSGRELRGRTFVPGLTTTAVQANGSIAAATKTGLDNAAAGLISNANSILAVWSRRGGVFSPTISGISWTDFATMRSRRD
jgi:hypothetical protein